MTIGSFIRMDVSRLAAILAVAIAAAGAPASGHAQAPNRAAMEARQFLSLALTFASECDNAAWSLWWSNDYEKWRKKRSGMLNIHYHSRTMEKTPSAPKSLDPALAQQLEQQIAKANDIVRGAQANFGMMANYINAKDYEDDKFKKGDELNAKLVEAGKSCFAIAKAMAPLYAQAQIDRAKTATAPSTPIRTAIREDFERVRKLEAALAKGGGNADEIAKAVADLSQAIERRQTEFAVEFGDSGKPAGRFYKVVNEDIAVPMRKQLRERAPAPKSWAEAFEDRPRSMVERMRNTILKGVSSDYADALTQE